MWESSNLAGTALWNGFPESVLVAYGAKLNYLINSPNREWWRLVTPMFIHVNLLHLLVNMYSLWIVGPYVEKLYGSAKFVVLWVLTGMAGVFASYITVRPALATGSLGRFLFKSQDVPSAGASGALFGLIGVLFIFGLKYRNELPEGFKRAFGTGMLPVILINLFIGYLGRGFIDNAAHLGGLVSGALLATAISYRRPGERAAITITWRLLQIAALGFVVLCFIKVAQKLSVHLSVIQPATVVSQKAQPFLAYVNTMNQAQEKVSAIIYAHDVSNIEAVSNSLASVPLPDAASGELRDRLSKILAAAATQATPKTESNTNQVGEVKVDQKLIDEFAVWRKDYDNWLRGAVAAPH
jgi:membrane associated rhomboid family serine protease